MANNLDNNSSPWVKTTITGYRNLETGEVVTGETINTPIFDWKSGDNPLSGGGRIHKEKDRIIKYPRTKRLRECVEDRGDRGKMNDLIDDMMGPSNILYRVLSDGELDKDFPADDEDVAEILDITPKKAREFLNRMIELDVIRKVEYYSKKFRRKIRIYVVNPIIVTFTAQEPVFLYFVFEDVRRLNNKNSMDKLFVDNLLREARTFIPRTETDKLIKDFILQKAAKFEKI